MSRCIELPSVSCAVSSSAIAFAGSTSSRPPRDRPRRPPRSRLQIRAQLRRGADLAEQLVVGARRAGQRVQPHELRPHHLRLGVAATAHRHLGVARAPARARASRARRGRIAGGHVHEQERARVHDHARLGSVGLDADRAREHRCGREALAQHGHVVEAVEQRQHELRARPRSARAPFAGPTALVATISASTGSSSLLDRTRVGGELAEAHALHAQRRARRSRRRSTSRATTITSVPARSSAPASSPPTPPGPRTATFTAPFAASGGAYPDV